MFIISKEDALEKGLDRYFTGKPCRNKHIAERYANAENRCIECLSLNRKKYYEENKDSCIARVRKYYSINGKRYTEYQKKWNLENIERVREKTRRYQTKKRGATPKWLNDSQIEKMVEIYKLARDKSLETGETYEVDHIVPIQGKNVCGLHVPWNLEVLKMSVNRAKSNAY